jgi:hypothetical protein
MMHGTLVVPVEPLVRHLSTDSTRVRGKKKPSHPAVNRRRTRASAFRRTAC